MVGAAVRVAFEEPVLAAVDAEEMMEAAAVDKLVCHVFVTHSIMEKHIRKIQHTDCVTLVLAGVRERAQGCLDVVATADLLDGSLNIGGIVFADSLIVTESILSARVRLAG